MISVVIDERVGIDQCDLTDQVVVTGLVATELTERGAQLLYCSHRVDKVAIGDCALTI